MTSELILYATPLGPLRDACEEYFDRLAQPTAAQTYPPHCTLTGFFHREPGDIGRIQAELSDSLHESGLGQDGLLPTGGASIEWLHVTDDWVGLELSSSLLLDLTQRFVSLHRTPDDAADELRPKSWLHLSLAYGAPDLEEAAELAADSFDPMPLGSWRVGLWERRRDGSWTRH